MGLLRRARGRAGAVRRRLATPRRARWGNLRRPRPFSERYGFDRGTPIDRVHLDRFFAANAADITGAVLEVKDPAFSGRHGHHIDRLDLVDIDPRNLEATIVADLAEEGSLPAATFDCILVPQTLQYVDDPAAALANAWRALRAGGVLLVTVPSVARLDPELREVERWRMPPAGLRALLERTCVGGDVHVEGHGNLTTTIAFLLGLAAEELRADELVRSDADFPLLACGRARRPIDRP